MRIAVIVLLSAFVISTESIAQPIPTPAAERMKSLQQKKAMEAGSPFQTSFRNIGPNVMSGRVVDTDVNPDEPTEFYVAYATGGLWHTTNNGQSFSPIFDKEDVIGLGDVAVHWPSRTIYLGTGEANSSRSSYSGLGVYKSTDGGKKWEHLGLEETHHIGEIIIHPADPNIAWVAATGHLYSPNNERGVYKTTDGGKTWKQTLYIDENTGAIELDMNGQNPNELYASMWYKTRKAWNFEESGKTSGIYKSTDGGDNWTLVSTSGSGLPSGEGMGRSGVAVFPGNPQIVYAVVDNQARRPDTAKRRSEIIPKEELKNQTTASFAQLDDKLLDSLLKSRRMYPTYTAEKLKADVASGKYKPTALYDYLYDANDDLFNTPIEGAQVYRSDDGGKSWKRMNTKGLGLYNTYGYYFGRITVSPTNPDKVVIMGVSVEMSTDGGKTFKAIGKRNTHSDHHSLWMNPKRDSHMVLGNDGGVNITYDNGENWFKANQPPVGQFYHVTTDMAKPYKVYGGLQDNGVWTGFTTRQRTTDANYDPFQYRSIAGGDGMMTQVDTRDNKTVYTGFQFGSYGRIHLDTGGYRSVRPQASLGEEKLRFNWLTPILLSSHNQDVLYIGSQFFHRSMNKGEKIEKLSGDLTNGAKPGDVPFATLSTISESPFRFGMLYCGTDDGNIHFSSDGGHSWTAIHQGLPKGLWVSRVVASRHTINTVYATLNGYRNDHFKAYIFRSDDNGKTWKSVAGNLPLEPVNVVMEDPKLPNVLYAGTDGGLYVSKDGGSNWQLWSKGMPHAIPVHDLAIQERENELIVGTHGRSLYVASLNEIQGVQKTGKEEKATENEDD